MSWRPQMFVASAGTRAIERTDRDGLADVSIRDLRRHLVRTALGDGTPPNVIMRAGGWDHIEGLAPPPGESSEDEVLDVLLSASVDSDERAISGDPDRTRQAIETARNAGSALLVVDI